MALKRVPYASPNYSSRGGVTVRLCVIHTAQGARTASDLGAFFANPSSGVSSHTGIDDTENTVWEYVQRSGKAWTAAAANPYSIQTELCAFAEWTPAEWDRHPNMLANTAQWIAEEARYFGIPIVRLTASQAQERAQQGVCQHVDLGSAGGGHWDCGPPSPWTTCWTWPAARPRCPPHPHLQEETTCSSNRQTVTCSGLSTRARTRYWRTVPEGQVGDIPAAQVISEPNGSWKALWRVGAPR